jgi:DNA adenine methylase
MKAPYSYFGGKASAADVVWDRFGAVDVYQEPFLGSGAVLLARPQCRGIETVNDINAWLVNFWRAVKHNPEGLVSVAEYPVSELDLHARGDWLFYRVDWKEWCEKFRGDPEFYDLKSAGWWWYGMLHAFANDWGRAKLGWNGKRQVNRSKPKNNVQVVSVAHSLEALKELSDRLLRVRILCGDWTRLVTKAETFGIGTTGIFLDPPYRVKDGGLETYGINSDMYVSKHVEEWCVDNGDNPSLRIALCGYEGEHKMPTDWECHEWKAIGGFGNQRKGGTNKNCELERIWFSPHCQKQNSLFSLIVES